MLLLKILKPNWHWLVLLKECQFQVIGEIIRGQAPDSEGGEWFWRGWWDLGGESKESENLTNFRGGILWLWGENWPKIFQRGGIFCQRVPFLKGGNLNRKFFWGGYPLDSFTLARVWTNHFQIHCSILNENVQKSLSTENVNELKGQFPSLKRTLLGKMPRIKMPSGVYFCCLQISSSCLPNTEKNLAE